MKKRFPVLWSSIIAGVLLMVAIADWPYGYYTFLRFVVCAASVFTAYNAFKVEKRFWMVACGAVAVLFNPIIPIYLTREIWAVLDVVSAVLLVVAGLSIRIPKEIAQTQDSNGSGITVQSTPQ